MLLALYILINYCKSEVKSIHTSVVLVYGFLNVSMVHFNHGVRHACGGAILFFFAVHYNLIPTEA